MFIFVSHNCDCGMIHMCVQALLQVKQEFKLVEIYDNLVLVKVRNLELEGAALFLLDAHCLY